MKLTNKNNLPIPVVRAVESYQKSYLEGRGETDISVTQLIDAPLIKRLYKLHGEQVEQDVSDMIPAFLGSCVHEKLEQNTPKEDSAEVRQFAEVLGWKVSGQYDCLDRFGTLSDYKVTSMYKIAKGKENIEWEQQLNVLKLLSELNGQKVYKLQVTAISKDYNKNKARFDDNLKPVSIIEFPIWSRFKVLRYLLTRIKLHQLADDKEPKEIPVCTEKERWAKPKTYKVKKLRAGKKEPAVRSTKNFEKIEDAEVFLKEKGEGFWLETVDGESTRCQAGYCDVKSWCPYYLSEKV